MSLRDGIALAPLVLLALLPSREVAAQISPGPLSRPHQALNGSDDCLECHTPARGVDPELCLGCHVVLSDRIERGIGLHASADYADCARCHVDHHGEDFELIWWGEAGRESFDHALAGYLLEGGHSTVACRDCHRGTNIAAPVAVDLLRAEKDLDRTFLGLERGCQSCHVDNHRGQFEDLTCDTCHVAARFKPATVNHDDSRFPLRGAHRDVECQGCHPTVAAGPGLDARGRSMRPSFVQYRTDKLACRNCHADEHRSQFGDTACSTCHTETTWRAATGFDHGDARFALTGKHQRVACEKCHSNESGVALPSGDRTFRRFKPVAFARCDNCHTDAHEGRLQGACASCHTTAGWDRQPVGFDHSLTRFALDGRHAQVECAGCHEPGKGFRVERFDTCEACHTDAHYGQIEPASRGCDECHSVEGFEPARFTVDDHADTRYPLTGTHLKVACNQCHEQRPVGLLEADGLLRAAHEVVVRDADLLTAQLRFAGFDCVSCHAQPHDEPAPPPLGPGRRVGCDSCHATDSWDRVSFDHAETGFVLDNQHLETACTDCHVPGTGLSTGGTTPPKVPFGGLGTTCAGCHQDIHRGQFATREGPAACETCHGTAAWAKSMFEHSATRFPLEGAHADVTCERCHTQETDARGSFLRYRPTPLECEACHRVPTAGGRP